MPSKKPEAQSNPFGVDSDNKYKIIYDTSYEGKLGYSLKEDSEWRQANYSRIKNFSGQLNELGGKGYKVISALPIELAAVVAPDETQYEYELFETVSPVFFAKVGLQEKLQEMSEKGFRLIAHSQLYPSCEARDSKDIAAGEDCEYTDRFLFEKEKGVKRNVEQVLVNTFPGWRAKPSVELEKQIDEKLAEGFYPVNVFSKFEILLEKTKDKDALLSDKPDVKVVRSSWTESGFEDKVNELAKQGYRLAMASNGIAVMYRNTETAQNPCSYIWLKTASTTWSLKRKANKNLEKDLAKLQAAGAVYRTTYPNEQGIEDRLIFERKLKDDGKRAEFKILKFEIDKKENQAEKKVYFELTPASKEAVKTMNVLGEEGFKVRDFFYSDGSSSTTDRFNIILERIK